MRIEDVARELKVSRDWLRRKEREGLFPPVMRNRIGHRQYSAADLEAIRRVVYHQPVTLVNNEQNMAHEDPDHARSCPRGARTR